jgi:hypothetical protein
MCHCERLLRNEAIFVFCRDCFVADAPRNDIPFPNLTPLPVKREGAYGAKDEWLMSEIRAPTMWSAGAALPLRGGEARLRPCSAPSMAWGNKSASMAGALQILASAHRFQT